MKMTNKIALIGALALAIVAQPAQGMDSFSQGMEYLKNGTTYCAKVIKKHPFISAGIALAGVGTAVYYYTRDNQPAPEQKKNGYFDDWGVRTQPVVKVVHTTHQVPQETPNPTVKVEEIEVVPTQIQAPITLPIVVETNTENSQVIDTTPPAKQPEIELEIKEEVKEQELSPEAATMFTAIKELLENKTQLDDQELWKKIVVLLNKLRGSVGQRYQNVQALQEAFKHNNGELLKLDPWTIENKLERCIALLINASIISQNVVDTSILNTIESEKLNTTLEFELQQLALTNQTIHTEPVTTEDKETPTKKKVFIINSSQKENRVKEHVAQIINLLEKNDWLGIVDILESLNNKGETQLLKDIIQHDGYKIFTYNNTETCKNLRALAIGTNLVTPEQLKQIRGKDIMLQMPTYVLKFENARQVQPEIITEVKPEVKPYVSPAKPYVEMIKRLLLLNKAKTTENETWGVILDILGEAEQKKVPLESIFQFNNYEVLTINPERDASKNLHPLAFKYGVSSESFFRIHNYSLECRAAVSLEEARTAYNLKKKSV